MGNLTVQHLVDHFQLEVVAGRKGIDRIVTSADIHRPGLEFTGYIGYFPNERVQILGRTEITYLHSLDVRRRDMCIGAVVALEPPCFIVTRGQQELEFFVKHCDAKGIPLLRTDSKSTRFISLLGNYLERELADEQTIHGVCMNIFGVGVALCGESGIGKSELALSLIERGHRLVSDDIVRVKRVGPDALVGTHNINNREMLHLRGIGFIDVTRLFGSGAFQDETHLDVEIELIHWDDHVNTNLISLGSEDVHVEYLGVVIPRIDIPVRPGRDIASLVEVACKNWRLKREGYDALQVFQERIWTKS
ncbi:HPr(Ser) kinase/phosphatase [Alicyclobacillus fastidiosus]|uniref:HPr kinase/phosphorylase n=1 Tax=Alicyclobacillus fastidiosus TaxID=392011 RepID=A0ABY6ZLY6_9BACL|nr:HPr(Ser) kinase/phosphatase [Alicyclobacillus fastidiosus]WAH43861.1 HPr(Ser) kinase/phosphatase [Alicyclobacillus fastidiosus]GMA60099.1 HPr kinase/phosphorylase [Alicyclobacillus fastidiosus]